MQGKEGTVTGLVMLHGYCSDTNPWENAPFAFDNAFYFLNPGASIANDAFALKVSDFVGENGLQSYGLVGHSQGGLVATHLLNYYFTGLDSAEGKQTVTTLGSPYMGCSAAGDSFCSGSRLLAFFLSHANTVCVLPRRLHRELGQDLRGGLR